MDETQEVRKLATIRKIAAIEDIVFINSEGQEETAANIVRATVDGWNLVTQRSNGFVPGDPCVYFEIDSLLPLDNSEFSFLKKKEETHHRLKTIRLKGQISQGLILPINVGLKVIVEQLKNGTLELDLKSNGKSVDGWEALTEAEKDSKVKSEVINGLIEALVRDVYDLTAAFGITKYEKPIPAHLAGKIKGNFPSFLRKTDEERCQNISWVLEKLADVPMYVTEKLDGTSSSFYYKDGAFGVCSRNLDLCETSDNTYWQVARKYAIEEKLAAMGNYAIQGEIVGPGIQGNHYKLSDVKLYVFNVFNIDEQRFLDFNDMVKFCKMTNLETVPIFQESVLLHTAKVSSLLSQANGPSLLNGTVLREGLIFRPIKEMFIDRLGRVSFKAISNEFLLKHGT